MLQFSQREAGSKRMVIMGCGELGASIAHSLAEQGHTLHLLDLHAEHFDRLSPGQVESGHIVPIIGDGTLQQDQMRASVPNADVFMALSDEDTANALAAQMSRHLYEVPTVICRIDDPTMQKVYSELGVVAISATSLVTEMVIKEAGT
jgi:trk system potassium uptake protein TrkA